MITCSCYLQTTLTVAIVRDKYICPCKGKRTFRRLKREGILLAVLHSHGSILLPHVNIRKCIDVMRRRKEKMQQKQKYKNTQLAAGNQLGLLYDPPCWNWFFWQWLYHSFKPCADLFLIDSISHVSLWLSLWQRFLVRWSLQWSLLNAHNDKTSSIWSSLKHN